MFRLKFLSTIVYIEIFPIACAQRHCYFMIDIVNVLAYGRVAVPYGISYLYSAYIGVKWNFSLFVDVRHFYSLV